MLKYLRMQLRNRVGYPLGQRLWIPFLSRRGWRRADYVRLNDSELRASFGYDGEEQIKYAARKVRANAMVSFERLATLWQQVHYLDRNKITGDFVECGVYRGGSIGLMALAHLDSHSTAYRHLHLFDSFEGLPEPVAGIDGERAAAFSGNRASGALKSVGQCVGTLADNRALLEHSIGYPTELIHYHVGWFQETLPRDSSSIGNISLLRLDGDWYDSTRLPLEHLYDKVVKGGVVIIDDYGHYDGCRRAVDEFIDNRNEPILMNHVDYSARCWVKI